MKIINVGYNHCDDSDFYIDRPEGSGDNLLILLKTDAVFNIDGKDIKIPENSFFMYKKGRPQRYRCVYQSVFANDWVHFEFEGDEEKEFFNLGLDYETPVLVEDMNFLSFCIKMMASENYSDNMNRHQSICHYIFLIFCKVGEYAVKKPESRKKQAIFPKKYSLFSHLLFNLPRGCKNLLCQRKNFVVTPVLFRSSGRISADFQGRT